MKEHEGYPMDTTSDIPDIIEKAIIILEDNPDIRSVSDLVGMSGKEIAVELFKFAKGL